MTNEEEERRRRIQQLLDSEAETRAELPYESKPEESNDPGTTQAHAPQRTPTPPPNIALDKDNMPLPRRVNETDMDGTRVSSVAYEATSRPRNETPAVRHIYPQLPLNPPVNPSVQPPSYSTASTRRTITSPWRMDSGCLVRLIIITLFSVVVAL